MSYSEHTVVSKLSGLNETQESIVGIAHWILFHKRYAAQSAQIWAKFLNDAVPNKKLGLIYLANEIVQQSRAKRKEEFVSSFGKILPESIADAYNKVPEEVKARIKRVVNVWRQRQIFKEDTLNDIELRIGVRTDQRVNNANQHHSGSGLVPTELASINTLGASVYRSDALERSQTALKAYESLFDSDVLPEPSVYLKTLETIDTKLRQSIDLLQKQIANRQKLNKEYEKLLEQSVDQLTQDQALLADLEAKLSHSRETKDELKDMVEQDQNGATDDHENKSTDENNDDQTDKLTSELFKEPTHEPDHAYQPESDDSTAPAYDPMSSDDEELDTEPAQKKFKSDSTTVTGLDPKIAALLSNFSQSSEDNDKKQDSN